MDKAFKGVKNNIGTDNKLILNRQLTNDRNKRITNKSIQDMKLTRSKKREIKTLRK